MEDNKTHQSHSEHGSEHREDNQPTQDIFQSKYVWIVGALLLVVAVWFSFKMLLGSGIDYTVTLVDAPKEMQAGGVTTFTWRVDGPPTTIEHTSVYMGKTSNPGELDKKVKPSDTVYTDFIKDFDKGNYNIPLQFVGNIKLVDPGKYYFRVQASVKDKNYWSDEYTFDVK